MMKFPKRLKLEYALDSLKGEEHQLNQDYALCRQVRAGLKHSVFVIGDGMGGLDASEKISQAAVRACLDQLSSIRTGTRAISSELLGSITQANSTVFQELHIEPAKTGTTILAFLIWNRRAYLAWLGDTRAYLWRDGILQQLTEDHTLAQELRKQNKLDLDKAEAQSHMLTRFIGKQQEMSADVVAMRMVNLQEKDVFLLVTDGITKVLSDEVLAQLASKQGAGNILKKMMAKLKKWYHDDDATAMVVCIVRDAPVAVYYAAWLGGLIVAASLLAFLLRMLR